MHLRISAVEKMQMLGIFCRQAWESHTWAFTGWFKPTHGLWAKARMLIVEMVNTLQNSQPAPGFRLNLKDSETKGNLCLFLCSVERHMWQYWLTWCPRRDKTMTKAGKKIPFLITYSSSSSPLFLINFHLFIFCLIIYFLGK